MDDHFEAQRRRLRQEMQAEIERIQATYRRRIDAVDRAAELMEFAASGETEPTENGDQAPAAISTTGSLREDLGHFVAGRTEPFDLGDVEARFPGVALKEIRTCLAQMARDGVVSIVEAGESGQPTRYEVPEPDYAGVPPRDRGGEP